MTKRYIDPDKINLKLGVLEADGELLIPLSAVRAAIAAAPSEDVVEAVRCEDIAVTEKDLAKMNKQIEEMARTMCRYYTTHGCALGTKSCGRHCDYYEDAERLYTAGYRKQSEVAREIFEEIDKILKSSQTELVGQKFYYRVIVDDRIAELKKKFTEGEDT